MTDDHHPCVECCHCHFTVLESIYYLTMKICSVYVLASLLALVSVSTLVSAAEECEVCVKVMDDVRSSMSKTDGRDKSKIEAALGDYCEHKATGSREKKICYYIDPIKREVAQPFSTGMPSLKVCKRISAQNPEICHVKFPIRTETLEKKDLSKMRVKQLKAILSERGTECKGCVEKEEFIRRVQETEHLAGQDL